MSLIAFQPGDVWPKEHLLTDAPDVMEHFAGDGDCHISLRFDDYLVDSRQSPVTVLSKEGSMNPMALGNMANHPAPDMQPNMQSTMIDYTAKMKLKRLQKYIPNTYAKDPSWQSRIFELEEVLMQGLCRLFVSPHLASTFASVVNGGLQSAITRQSPESKSL